MTGGRCRRRLLAADDPAAAFLASLGVAATEPEDVLALLEHAPERTVEVQLREARTLIEAGRHDDADALLTEIALADPWEWRVTWTTGLNALAQCPVRPGAASEFRSVYASLPGELAPKLAMAYAAESADDLAEAAHWYDIVSTTDPGFTSAVFGLARCSHRVSATSPARSTRTSASPPVRACTSTRRWRRPKRCSTPMPVR